MILKKTVSWQRVWPGLLGALGVGLVGACAWPYTVDDAYIVARYALRLSNGHGYTWNPGPATDGVTAPAWLVPGLLAAAGGYDPVIALKVVGLCCAALAAYVCISEQAQRARGRQLGWMTALLLLCQPSLGGSGSSGLETGAATLALTIAAHAALAKRLQLIRLGLAIAVSAWLRPELALSCAVFLTAATLRVGFRAASRAWTIAAASALAVCLFHWKLSGALLPLAWRAKAGTLQDGAVYALRAVPVLSGVLGLMLVVAGASLGQFRERARAWALLVHLAAVVLAGGDWMPGFRLWVPLYPQYAALAAVGAERLWRRGAFARALAGAGLLAAAAVPLLDLSLRLPEWQRAGASRDSVGAAIARELREHSQRVALVDIGYLGYTSGVETIDLAGLTDPEVAAFPGGHLAKRIPSAWLEAQAPDTLLLHSSLPPLAADDGRLLELRGYPVEMRVARFEWVQRNFRVARIFAYGPNYHYALLRRP